MIICTGIIPAMDKSKRPRGRPPLDDGETERLEIRLSPARKARYEAAATRVGLKVAAWIKRVLDRASRR